MAEWIGWLLEETGSKVVLLTWDFGVGRNFVLEMQRAAKTADRTIARISLPRNGLRLRRIPSG